MLDGTKEARTLATLLEESLSTADVRRVFEESVFALDAAGRERLLSRLEPSTAETLRSLFRTPGAQARPEQSRSRILEDWNDAWAQWDAWILTATATWPRWTSWNR